MAALTPLAAFTLLLAYLLRTFVLLLYRQCRSPLNHLRGPFSPSFFMGNLEEMHDQENNNLIARWEEKYGMTIVYRGFFGGCRLLTTDPVAVAHILGNAYEYPKPDFVRDSLASMAVGYDGLLTVEGDDHRRQRKILTPAFSAAQIRALTPIFWKKAEELRSIWQSQICDTPNADSEATSSARVDVLSWLSRATLDVIGLAGFGYAFNSLTDPSNELARAFAVIFSSARKFRVMTILQVWFPFLLRFRRNNPAMAHAKATMRRIGLALIEERRKEIIDEQRGEEHEIGDVGSKAEEDHTKLGRDILSVLIRSNLSSVPSQRMTVEEVLCQISTFLAAGHETTSSALTWCLYALSKDHTIQARLREALIEVEAEARVLAQAQAASSSLKTPPSSDRPSEPSSSLEHSSEIDYDLLTSCLNRCTYLDWVVRESLRLHAPVTTTMRVCMRDEDEIPVSYDGYVDKHRKRRWTIPVKKWDIVSVPIQAINRSEKLWGNDAGVFRPERWAAPPEDVRAIPGLYSNMLTFLNGNALGGNRACIGYKFALVEIKIFLYVLMKDIEFTIDPSIVIEKKVNVVTRPFVKSEPHLGNQMPLNISRASSSAIGDGS